MKFVEVGFETEKPVCFREYHVRPEICFVIDLDLSAKFLGVSKVFDHDDNLYADEDAVSMAIRSNCADIITKCLNDEWEEEVSVCLKWQIRLPEMFDKELEKLGIKAETNFTHMVLTEESAKELRERREEEVRLSIEQNPIYVDHMYSEPTVLMNYVNNKTSEVKAVTLSGDKFCRNCGAALKGTAKFCEECGTEIVNIQ